MDRKWNMEDQLDILGRNGLLRRTLAVRKYKRFQETGHPGGPYCKRAVRGFHARQSVSGRLLLAKEMTWTTRMCV